MKIKNKTIWITGASSGIGEALALELSRESANLLLSARNTEKLESVKQNCLNLGAAAVHVIQLDLTDQQSILKAFEGAKSISPRIDLLINNGGISQRSLVFETPVEVDRKVMEVNYFGAVSLTKLALPLMKAQGGGHIAVVSSVVGKFGFPLRSAYSAAKHALHGFFDTLRAEEKKNNIDVTIIVPGRVRTNISLNAVTKSGKAHGKMDEGQESGIPAEACARKIIKALKHNKKEVLIGGKELMMVHLRRFLPGIYYHLASKIKPT